MCKVFSRMCVGAAALGLAATLTGCDRTVVRTRRSSDSPAQEVTISSPGTAASKERPVVVNQPPAAPTEIVTTQPAPPPPPPTEVRTVSPDPAYVWVPGAYEWTGGRWQWNPGHWVTPGPVGATWEPAHWEAVPGGWQWQPGRWR